MERGTVHSPHALRANPAAVAAASRPAAGGFRLPLALRPLPLLALAPRLLRARHPGATRPGRPSHCPSRNPDRAGVLGRAGRPPGAAAQYPLSKGYCAP